MFRSNLKWCAVLGLTLINSGALVAGVAGAAAPDPQAPPTMVLQFSPETLAQPGGAERLYARIQQAAHVMCGTPDVRDLPLYFKAQRCYDTAVDNAVARINESSLTALHRSKSRAVSG